MTILVEETYTPVGGGVADDASRSAVSWPAILAGAVVAAASSLILVALGSGFGLAVASPWPGAGPSTGAFVITTGIWLIVTQWIASGVGGYTAGRLRTRWSGVHAHEVFFRDTAHGLLTWATATVIVAALVVGAGLLAARPSTAAAADAVTYQADTLLRAPRVEPTPGATASRTEAAAILARASAPTGLAAPDRAYLIDLTAARTGVSQREAEGRVDAAIATVRHDADVARKAASATAIFTGLSMLIGAFIACVAAALGGRERDEHL
jgi:hypothetical protein